ncbi:hypothetical protein KSP39_PZI020918 [Platanthera zijinensis]|uniref:DUF868 family protein n=1 Tax=Platanthera zijinensis TaxID=2320716 RepID=A0AAP0FW96_9ASPA
MPDPIPSCFRGSAAGVPPASTVAGPSLTTSVFETNLGLASFSWSRTVLGLSLRADLRLSPASSSGNEDKDKDDEPFRFRIRPWLFWKRKGTRRFHLEEGALGRHRVIEIAWDLTRARFPSTGGPEPSSNFYVAVSVDGEMLLVAGDMEEEAHRKMKASKRKPAMPISKREHVLLKADPDTGGRRSYRTLARVMGREREITIGIGGKEKDSSGMYVAVDGTKILQVRRLRWKFRGSERVEIDGNGGGRVQISWDLHSWLFPSKEDAIPASVASAAMCEIGQAVFVFRFDSHEADKREDWISGETETGYPGGGSSDQLNMGLIPGYLGKDRNWNESSGGVGERRKGKKKSLLKTSSSSSSSSSSSAGSSSVMEWVSREEAELRGVDGYTLVVYAWKS